MTQFEVSAQDLAVLQHAYVWKTAGGSGVLDVLVNWGLRPVDAVKRLERLVAAGLLEPSHSLCYAVPTVAGLKVLGVEDV